MPLWSARRTATRSANSPLVLGIELVRLRQLHQGFFDRWRTGRQMLRTHRLLRTAELHADVVQWLSSPEAYRHPAETVRVIETHISFVFLAGSFAYKLKKPVQFDFLDFSSLESRARVS